MANIIRENGDRIIVYLAEYATGENDPRKGRHELKGPQLAEGIGLDPASVNDAVEYLSTERLVKIRRYFGTAPYEFGEVELTPQGRVYYHDIKENAS